MVNWHHFHGTATRIPAEAIAFGLCQEHFMVEIVASWEPDGSNGAAHRQWAQDLTAGEVVRTANTFEAIGSQ
jgi:hypothetical protein